ncbi:hypothetical protein A2Z00_03520 [Candidatus Gottesmanbacteria bacterium RBG_13_45_10]|uniref:Type 4 fimbrial biogenesis protein PilX N-terminal domain-containing protein n=1 Tax=Candidatus Gottesmanbacteria bacterium RBG_13_45_10 TaxID=1798370 RepID=A0A1F5ZG66_9BACT|nr:MAG: hypothetical protein A2Z00_03520 [Candidatus Gottesmanbacteria bacterium RBG_13_45_10]
MKVRDVGKQSGQVVLITLLVLTIATTVALSLISRTTTDTSITNQVEESSRAFSAAEAGIEEALKIGVGTSLPTAIIGSPDVSYSVSMASIGGAAGAYQFPRKTLKDTTETVWLVDHQSSGALAEPLSPTYVSPSIDICWSSESTTPALVVTVLYRESSDGSYRILKGAYDPNSSRTSANKFSAPTASTGGCSGTTNTTYRETFTFNALNPSVDPATDTLIALRLRPIYSDATLAVNAVMALPLQGNRIESTGSTQTGTNRKIVVFQEYRAPASMFDAAIYSYSPLGGTFGH